MGFDSVLSREERSGNRGSAAFENLFIRDQDGPSFRGRTSYPTFGNGVLSFSGSLEGGRVFFREDQVISGQVGAGYQYTGTINGRRISGMFQGPNGQRGQFTLRLVD